MVQKIIKVGNSYGIILPKELMVQVGLKTGDEVDIESLPQSSMLTITSVGSPYKSKITPEFKNWLDDFTNKHKDLLKELARTP